MSSSTVSKLAELSGLEGAKKAIERIARPESSVHAVLLYGAEGAGKEKLAMALAQAWLCTQPLDGGACGACRACESFERDRSADVLRIVPRGPSEIIKQNAITEVRTDTDESPPLPLIDFFRTQPLLARNKVALILSADRMNPTASNAFLKTLEEPQPYGKIVMTTAEISRVFPTIISRCVCVSCELPRKEEVTGLTADAPHELIDLAEGAPGRLATILLHADAYQKIIGFAQRVVHAPRSHALALSEEFRGICDELEKALRCNARAANVEGLRALGAALSSLVSRDDWFLAIAEAHRRIQGNGNASAVLDAMFSTML